MMTLEEIRHVEFTRGRGYRAEEVDDFIDECVETLEQYRKDNEEANQKLKLLADKLAEYRNDEDSIRAALLNAQRAGDTALREAEEKAALIIEEAQLRAKEIEEEAKKQIGAQQQELERVRREVSQFKQQMLTMYKEHLAQINVLPEVEEVSSTEAAEEVVTVAPVEEEDVAAPLQSQEEQQPLSRFADLKFGEDYRIEDDTDDDEEKAPRGFFRKKK